MGSYRNAVITNQGLDYIAQALAGEIMLTFSHMAISDYAYPEGTNLAALTSLQSVKMTVVPASVWVQDTTVGVRGMFSNTTVATEYPINTVGVYATNGTTEILFSVSTATSPDIMEVYNGVAPSSFIFTVQETINEASSLNITVSEAGMATAQDIADLQEQKQDVITGAASTITDANLTASRALASDASGKVVASPVTATELGYLDGVTSPLQTQIDNKQASITGGASTIATTNLTASRALVSNSTGKVAVSSVTATELGRLAGVTGNVQEQINALHVQRVSTAGENLNNYTTFGTYYFASDATPINIPEGVNGYLIVLPSVPSGTGIVRQIWLRGGTTGTNDYNMWVRTNYKNNTATEWGDWVRILTDKDTLLSGAASTIETANLTASRALISNSAGKVAVSEVTSTELGYLDGVTSAIQTQLNNKVTNSFTASRALGVNASGKVAVASTTTTELNYLSGVTSNVQTQLNSKQATITGGASTITSSNLTASRALISNASGKVAVSAVTSTELGYLDGVTSNVQTQINNAKVTLRNNQITFDNVNVSSATSTSGDVTLGTFALPAGNYLVIISCSWGDTDINSSSSGHRALWMTSTQNGAITTATNMASNSVGAPPTGFNTRQNFTVTLSVTSQTTYYIRARQYNTKGTKTTATARLSVVKLSS